MENHLDLTPDPRILEVLGDIPFQPWQCLAELIDNSFDAFQSQGELPEGSERPTAWLEVPKSSTADDPDAFVRAADNGPGMDEATMEKSLKAGYSGNTRYGSFGLFGMGFNIATARLGRVVEVRTTRAGDRSWSVVKIEFRDMQARRTFQAPLTYEPKPDPAVSGTEIIVSQLTPEMRQAFKRAQLIKGLRDQLGRVYSYVLRDGGVPGLPTTNTVGRGYLLKLNSQVVRPHLHCVWSPDRSVMVSGVEIPAVAIVDRSLSPAYACQNCGAWYSIATDACTDCSSEDIKLYERKVHGWIGVQRYLHASDYGLDFLRNGRKILVSDKRIFTWDDPTGLSSMVEYPIELPANQGRLIGEIHLDHVAVNYQKNDFERDTREWLDAIRIIRGEGPIQPRKARDLHYDENHSPLARLFSGYRRNDAGTKGLVPGDGTNALHERARQWGVAFRNGQAEYQTDELWYENVLEHDRIKLGTSAAPNPDDDDLRGRLGLDADEPVGANGGNQDEPPDEPPPAPETESERFDRYRASARSLPGIEGQISLGRYARKTVQTYLTAASLVDAEGQNVPSLAHALRGGDIEVFLNPNHPVFLEYGRDLRDFAWMEIAESLRTMSSSDMSLTAATAEVISQFPDQRFTDSAIRERAESLVSDACDALQVNVDISQELWLALSAGRKEATEVRAAGANADLDWGVVTRDGGFLQYLDASSLAELVRNDPGRMLDGQVFRTKYATWTSEDTRDRMAEGVARLLDTVAEYLSDPSARGFGQLRLIQVVLDNLASDLVTRS